MPHSAAPTFWTCPRRVFFTKDLRCSIFKRNSEPHTFPCMGARSPSMFKVLLRLLLLPACRCDRKTCTNDAKLATALCHIYRRVCKECRMLFSHEWQLHLQAATTRHGADYRPCIAAHPVASYCAPRTTACERRQHCAVDHGACLKSLI